MRVVIVGATGNAGTALLRRMHEEPDVELAGVSRRRPDAVGVYRDVEWHAVDVAGEGAAGRLAEAFRGADAVVNDPRLAASVFHGVRVPVPGPALAGAAALSWWLRLQPIDAGWIHLALKAPLMWCARAREELGWEPRRDAVATLRELIAGMAERADAPSPPLTGAPDRPGRPGGLLRGRLPGSGDPYRGDPY